MATGGGVLVVLIAAGLLADTQHGRAFIKETGVNAAAKALPGKAGRAAGRLAAAGSARGAVKARAAGQRTQRAARAAGGRTTTKAAARWDKRQAAGRPVPLISRVRPEPVALSQAATSSNAAPVAATPTVAAAHPASPTSAAQADPAAVRGRSTDVPVSSMAASGGPSLNKEHDMPEMYFDFTDAPESDADHLDRLQGLARGLNSISEGIAQYEETLVSVGLDAKSFSGLGEAAEAAAEAASSLSSAARRFASVYQGVIETVANGTKLPDGRFFTGEAA
ncbi:MAG: hypothetical protein ACRC0L_10970 [Angustibacter sp.]